MGTPEVVGATDQVGRGHWAHRLLYLVAITATLATAGTGMLLQHYADQRREAVVLLTQLEALANQDTYLTYQAVLQNADPTAVAHQEDATTAALQGTLNQFRQLGVEPQVGTDLEDATARASQALRELRPSLASDQMDAAAATQHNAVDPALDRIRTIVSAAITRETGDLNRAENVAVFGSSAIIVGAGLGLMAIFAWARRRGRREDLVEGERRALVGSERKYRALVQNSFDVVLVVNSQGVIQYASESMSRIFGHDSGELLGTPLEKLAHPEDADHLMVRTTSSAATDGEGALLECRLGRQTDWRDAEIAVTNLIDNPDVAGIVLHVRDVSERKELERQLTYRAFHDSLTGLPNRSLFKDRLDHALSQLTRSHDSLTLLLVDLDGFKAVNDTHGHLVGDKLLRAVGQRLTSCLRPGDTVARFGGDEFAVLLPGAPTERGQLVADRLATSLGRPMRLDGVEILPSASIGIASASVTAADSVSLLRNADAAMYVAKRQGKARCEVFSEAMHGKVLSSLGLRAELQNAIQHNEFALVYQPIVDVITAQTVAVEALVRWPHRERGLISPMDFIPMAEETGLIVPLGDWILSEACRQLAVWQLSLPAGVPLSLSVNVSPRQIQEGFAIRVQRVIEETGIDASTLIIEVTESVLVADDSDGILEQLHAIRKLGVRIAIDDFGTGYSSLGYLRRLPRDIVKLDRSFIIEVPTTGQDHSFMQSIVNLLGTLSVQIIAEGVETTEQLEHVRALGCELAQGYYFHRPMDADAMSEVIEGMGSTIDRISIA